MACFFLNQQCIARLPLNTFQNRTSNSCKVIGRYIFMLFFKIFVKICIQKSLISMYKYILYSFGSISSASVNSLSFSFKKCWFPHLELSSTEQLLMYKLILNLSSFMEFLCKNLKMFKSLNFLNHFRYNNRQLKAQVIS